MPGNVLLGWLGPLFVAALGAFLRFDRLGLPKAVVFDETFYAKDAYSLSLFGVERATLGDASNPISDRMLIAGNTDIWIGCSPPEAAPCPQYVAH
ncbi:phospholipid carrier-dependent glycosyltransferase, partial [Streptosporangium sp. NPDC020072]